MTIVVVVLFGAGVLFVTSALENCPIVSTFQHIIQGDTIDWSGKTSPCSSGTNTTQPQAGSPAVVGGGALSNPDANGQCPKGTTQVTVSGGKIMCQKNA